MSVLLLRPSSSLALPCTIRQAHHRERPQRPVSLRRQRIDA